MKKIKIFAIYFLVFLVLIIPAISLAQPTMISPNGKSLVPCNNTPVMNGGTVSMNPDGTVQYQKQCDWNALMSLVNNIINFILYYMAIPIAAIMFAYAGFLMVTAGGEAAGARTKAKGIFTNAVIGLVLAAACWLIIKLILSVTGYNGAWIGF
jgi:hypothetical protein